MKVGVAAVEQKPQQEKYDVYVDESTPLEAGVEKHIISIFVADESGLINRVTGVFGRRGANIESLAVGTTVDKALFTIVVTGTESYTANLVKQLTKLVNVRYVEDITSTRRVEREMLLLKLNVKPGPDRTEVMQLAQVFRAKVSDVSDVSLTLCVTGDPGKCAAVQKVMSRFGVLEIVRTGRICLKRGDEQLSPKHAMMSYDEIYDGDMLGSPETNGDSKESGTAVVPVDEESAGVYRVDHREPAGVWQVQNILDPTYSNKLTEKFNAHTLSIEVQDQPGVLNQVTGVFARRGYNIQSLAVGPSEKPNTSRICMVVPGNEESIQKLFKQLSKLVWVQSLTDLTYSPFLYRELMLVKVRCNAAQREQLRALEQVFRASILDVSPNTMVLEVIGKEDKLKAMTDLLEPYGILEIARTGRIALPRDSGVDSMFLERMKERRVY